MFLWIHVVGFYFCRADHMLCALQCFPLSDRRFQLVYVLFWCACLKNEKHAQSHAHRLGSRRPYAASRVGIYRNGHLLWGPKQLVCCGWLPLLLLWHFTTQTAYVNLRSFPKLHKADKMWWWFAHMNGMCGALIASITAFMVQNGQIFKLPSEMMWMPWVIPTLIGAPLISYAMNKYRKQFKVGRYAPNKP